MNISTMSNYIAWFLHNFAILEYAQAKQGRPSGPLLLCLGYPHIKWIDSLKFARTCWWSDKQMSGSYVKEGMLSYPKSGDLAFFLCKDTQYYFWVRYWLFFKLDHSMNDGIKVAWVSKFIMGNLRMDIKW